MLAGGLSQRLVRFAGTRGIVFEMFPQKPLDAPLPCIHRLHRTTLFIIGLQEYSALEPQPVSLSHQVPRTCLGEHTVLQDRFQKRSLTLLPTVLVRLGKYGTNLACQTCQLEPNAIFNEETAFDNLGTTSPIVIPTP